MRKHHYYYLKESAGRVVHVCSMKVTKEHHPGSIALEGVLKKGTSMANQQSGGGY